MIRSRTRSLDTPILDATIIDRLRNLEHRASATVPRAERRPNDGRPNDGRPTVPLAGSECVNAWGRHWRIDCPVDGLLPELARELAQSERPRSEHPLDETAEAECGKGEPGNDECAKGPAKSREVAAHRELAELSVKLRTNALFTDLETCGFAGSIIFLVGLVRPTADGLVLTQFLARDYSEEKAILQSAWNAVSECELLVTFNGKSFDWPCLHDRSTLHHLGSDPRPDGAEGPAIHSARLERHDARPRPQHIDLLHHSRRRWRDRLPNCRLQTLEQHLCGRFRVADIAGADIPAAYHAFVRSGSTGPICSILHHNALDLLTLVQVALRLVDPAHASPRPRVATPRAARGTRAT